LYQQIDGRNRAGFEGLDSCGESTGILCQRALSTDPELDADIDCCESAVEI